MNPLFAKVAVWFKKTAGVIAANKVKSIIIGSVVAVSVSGITAGVIIGTSHKHEPMDAVMENVTEATCLSEGSYDEVIYCAECGDEIGREKKSIGAKGHTEKILVGKSASCTEPGITDGVACSVCEVVLTAQLVIPAKGHSYDDNLDAECNICGSEREVVCLHENTETIPEVSATCENVGYTEGLKCLDCDKVIVEPEVIPSLDHDMKYYSEKKPTCENVGWNEYGDCSRCGYSTFEEIPALGHDEIEHGERKPTCTDIGWEAYVSCSRCDYSTYEEIEEKGHTETVLPGVKATCTAGGKTDGVICSECQTILSPRVDIPMIPHEYDDNYDETCNECGYVRDADCPHENKKIYPAKPVTCEENGVTEGITCADCGYVFTEQTVILAPGHDEITVEGLAPTCTSEGYTSSKKCSVCDKITKSPIKLEKVAHTFDNEYDTICNACGFERDIECNHNNTQLIQGLAPTCDESGITDGLKCLDCNMIIEEQRELSPLDHNVVHYDAASPTCTEDGHNAYVSCTRCDYTTKRVIESLGHDLEHFDALDPTCVLAGHNSYESCSRCDHTTYEEISALGHNPVEHTAKAATCEEKGHNAYVTCSRCEYTTYEETAALGHKEKTISGKAATCTATGLTDGVICERCEKVLLAQTEIAKLAHEYDDKYDATCNECGFVRDAECAHLNKEVIPEVSATCTTAGYTAGEKCSDCGKITILVNEVPKLGHNTTSYPEKAATCEEKGHNAYVTCSRCDYTTYEEIAALGHKEKTISGKAATCTATGLTGGMICERCEKVLLAQTEIAKLAHEYDDKYDATCNECGFVRDAECAHLNKEVIPEVSAMLMFPQQQNN